MSCPISFVEANNTDAVGNAAGVEAVKIEIIRLKLTSCVARILIETLVNLFLIWLLVNIFLLSPLICAEIFSG